MQKIVFLTVVMIAAIATQAQWKWLNPKPSGHHNTKITFVDNQHGFLFNSIGELYETVDTGNSWQLQQRFPNANVFALKDSTGVIGGNSGFIYISEDYGQHWQIKNIDQNINIAWIDITSRDTIFLIGSGNLYRSVNRGNSWELMNNSFTFRLPSVDFVSAKTGYAVYPASSIYKTVDGGKTWNVVNGNSTSANSTSLKFADSLFGYAYRETDTILRTTDGGKTWTAATHAAERVNDIFIINAQKAFAVGDDGVIYKTVDGGANWTYSGSPTLVRYGNTLSSVYFINENIGFAAGLWGRVLKTTDGGTTWKEYSPSYTNLWALSMVSPGTGYTISWNNIYRTTDSGNTWQSLPLTLGANYSRPQGFDNCIFFNADTGLATSFNYARIFRTANGGQSFDTINPFPNDEDAILGISFINASKGWCTIRTSNPNYKVYRTQDGGRNWSEISAAANGPKKIFFVNEAVGYGAQYGGIVQTMDSGKTWTQVYMDYDNAYNSLWFVNAKKGFAAGEHGKLRMTNDSGRTWTTSSFNDFYDDFLNVRFFNDSVGYLTGEGGGIFKTIDGGLTWKRRGLPPFFDYHDYRAISFTSDSSVYIAGTNGSIIKSSIAEVVVDSLQANNITGCSAGFSAKITADLCSVDSAWFQFGIDRFDRSVAASPAAVTNGTIKVTAQALNLVSNTAYRVKVKVLYGGKYYYSDEIVCKTRALVTPVITVNNYVLTSSVDTGNQWYRNDTLIPGAVNKQYTVVTTGAYKTRVLNGNCPAAFSQPVQVTMPVVPPPVTGIIDPVLNAALRIYPNPVYDRIQIDNENRYRLGISITDITGQQVIRLNQTREQLISLPAQKLSPGIYLLHITDLQTKRMITRKFVKLQ